MGVAWITLAWFNQRSHSIGTGEVVGILLMMGLALISVLVRDLPLEATQTSFTTAVLLACIPLFGPLVAGVIGLLAAVADRGHGWSIVPVFNGLMIGTQTLLGGAVYVLLGGIHPLGPGYQPFDLVLHVGAPLVAADLVMCLANALILAGMVAITGGNPRAVLAGTVRELLPLYLGYVVIGFVLALLWGPAGVGGFSAVLIAAPLAIARLIYMQYGDEMRAHSRILASFTTAGDGPSGSVAAHAARTSILCGWLAEELGLPDSDRRALEFAAALHDVGMKGVLRETDALKGGGSPYTNTAAIAIHPILAERMISDVAFLRDAASTIRAHHERIDGRGYPDRLMGDQIPLTARILAVADAFDALTTSRGDDPALTVPEAMAELREVAGTHLDRDIVDALHEVLKVRDWAPHNDPVTEGSWLWDRHALPAMSDVIADDLDLQPEPAAVRE